MFKRGDKIRLKYYKNWWTLAEHSSYKMSTGFYQDIHSYFQASNKFAVVTVTGNPRGGETEIFFSIDGVAAWAPAKCVEKFVREHNHPLTSVFK